MSFCSKNTVVFGGTAENSVFKTSPLIATIPSFSIFTAGIVISTPILRFVALITRFLPEAINKIELSTGSVKFLPVTLSAIVSAFLIFSIEHSIFINIFY